MVFDLSNCVSLYFDHSYQPPYFEDWSLPGVKNMTSSTFIVLLDGPLLSMPALSLLYIPTLNCECITFVRDINLDV